MSRRARQRALARPWEQGEAQEPIDDQDNEFDWAEEFEDQQQQDDPT